jgi:hypothetical protein
MKQKENYILYCAGGQRDCGNREINNKGSCGSEGSLPKIHPKMKENATCMSGSGQAVGESWGLVGK